MTPMNDEHKALLGNIQRNTNDDTAKKVYADWLQEQGNPGWVIVLNYPPQDWPVRCNKDGTAARYGAFVRLPWLTGVVNSPNRSHHLQRVKLILKSYIEGKINGNRD